MGFISLSTGLRKLFFPLISPKFLNIFLFNETFCYFYFDVFLSLIMKENEAKVIKLLICFDTFDTLICFGPNKGVPNIFL